MGEKIVDGTFLYKRVFGVIIALKASISFTSLSMVNFISFDFRKRMRSFFPFSSIAAISFSYLHLKKCSKLLLMRKMFCMFFKDG